jgi:cell division protein FtsB
LEFSFDRSNESARQRSGNQTAETTSSGPRLADDDGVDPSTITNERLKKAIEKNRARQAERSRGHQETVQSAAQQPLSSNDNITPNPPPLRPHAKERIHTVSRRSTAKADEADFTPVKRTSRKVASQISYSTSTGRKKNKPMDPVVANYLAKGAWIFCGVMILRLIFAHGGVTDFYSQSTLYDNRLEELDRIKKENMHFVQEIERMQTDASFQKKLVRDNLGFIAIDEFLVLFPKEKSVQ